MPHVERESSPVRVLQTVTPPGLLVRAAFDAPGPADAPRPLRAVLTVAWERGSDEAARMERSVLDVADELLGPDAPLLVRAGDLWSPLRHGDLERPADPACRGRLFAVFRGELELLLDARTADVRTLDPSEPAHLDLLRAGCLVRVNAFVFAAAGCVEVQLAGAVAILRGAPGLEGWESSAHALS